jgi:hypothetical protein
VSVQVAIWNETGLKMWYWYRGMTPIAIENGEKKIDSIHALIQSDSDLNSDDDLRNLLSLHLKGGWDAIHNLPTTQETTITIPLSPRPANGLVAMSFDVRVDEGKKILLFRSNVIILNSTTFPLHFRSEYLNDVCLHRTLPGVAFHVPIGHTIGGIVSFRSELFYDGATLDNDLSTNLDLSGLTNTSINFQSFLRETNNSESFNSREVEMSDWNDRPLILQQMGSGSYYTQTKCSPSVAGINSLNPMPIKVTSRSLNFHVTIQCIRRSEGSPADYRISISPPLLIVNLLASEVQIVVLDQYGKKIDPPDPALHKLLSRGASWGVHGLQVRL